ncbi:MAG TPA: nitronate monooxygenase [Jatrophihabitantaceae bacterium]|nr:nitronate monooxygenase [Jatrophihabitantaceae bacterium]
MADLLPSELPIVQAPMAGGPSTPELTAAVSSAGGYGYVAAGYLSCEALRGQVERTRSLTDAPFGVNVFVPSQRGDQASVRAYAASLQGEADRLGVDLGAPLWNDDGYDEKLSLLGELGVHCASFTFGCPDASDVNWLHVAGTLVLVTVTSLQEAVQARAAGADGLLVQGTEAGGHQARFLGDEVNATPLSRALDDIGEAGLPMIAAGGIMTGADARAAFDHGAIGVALGTALLCTPEAATSAVHRRALRDGLYTDTVVTRAFSGRYARGLRNRFASEHEDAPAAYPEIHHLTRPLRVAATAAGDPDVPNLWAGTGWRQISAEPAGAVVRRVAAEARNRP